MSTILGFVFSNRTTATLMTSTTAARQSLIIFCRSRHIKHCSVVFRRCSHWLAIDWHYYWFSCSGFIGVDLLPVLQVLRVGIDRQLLITSLLFYLQADCNWTIVLRTKRFMWIVSHRTLQWSRLSLASYIHYKLWHSGTSTEEIFRLEHSRRREKLECKNECPPDWIRCKLFFFIARHRWWRYFIEHEYYEFSV